MGSSLMSEKRNPPETLKKVLRDEALCCAFFCYLKETRKENHLIFWLEAEEYRYLSINDREAHSKDIFNKYFAADSPTYLNMETHELWEVVELNSENCFESAQHSSFLHLSGFFEAFLQSQI